jgi:outer membrane protein TolC
VFDAKRDRFVAEQALMQTRGALLSSSVNLYAALKAWDSSLLIFLIGVKRLSKETEEYE